MMPNLITVFFKDNIVCLLGSLTGAVASQKVTEVFEGRV